MAFPVYSTQLINSHADGGYSLEVPAGYRAVIRSIAAFNANGLLGEPLQLSLTSTGATFFKATIAAESSINVDMHVVVNSTDTIVVSAGVDIDVVVSGYLLTLP